MNPKPQCYISDSRAAVAGPPHLRGILRRLAHRLTYARGGPACARFEWSTETFGWFGGTVGAVFERKIAPLRVEYRHTEFQNRTVGNNISSTGTTVSTGAEPSTETNVNSGTTTNAVTADMQSIMFGISREFGTY
jgi:hypothetical protein